MSGHLLRSPGVVRRVCNIFYRILLLSITEQSRIGGPAVTGLAPACKQSVHDRYDITLNSPPSHHPTHNPTHHPTISPISPHHPTHLTIPVPAWHGSTNPRPTTSSNSSTNQLESSQHISSQFHHRPTKVLGFEFFFLFLLLILPILPPFSPPITYPYPSLRSTYILPPMHRLLDG